MKTTNQIIDIYAHDFRDIALPEDKLKEVLTCFLDEITENRVIKVKVINQGGFLDQFDCLNCDSMVEQDNNFCPGCGYKIIKL